MKTIKRRAFCKAAAAAVAGVLAPHAAAEALLPQAAQAVVGSAVPEDYYSFAFRSDHSETDLSHDFYYTDAFFENTALQYSHKLALATLGLVAASGNTYQSDALYWVEGEAGREDSIADAYQKLGFANAVYAGYQCSLNTPVDTAGCAFAQKTLVQDGQRTTIIAAMLRGVGYGAEWASNLHVGEGGGHYGFVTAAEHFFEDLQDYLKKAEAAAGTLGTIKLWLGGYSGGAHPAAAAADRAGKYLCLHLCRTGGTDGSGPPGSAGGLRQRPHCRRRTENGLGCKQYLQHHFQRRHRGPRDAGRVGLPPQRKRPLSALHGVPERAG